MDMGTKRTLLIVEDDPVLGRGIAVNMGMEGYETTWARRIADAKAELKKKPVDLVLLDQGLPDGDGLSLLKALRAEGSKIPVIILTAKTDEDSVVAGLKAGANDYVRKPFGTKELLARIEAALRQVEPTSANRQYGELSVNLDRRKAYYGEQELDLNRREFDILQYFVEHAESVVTREALLSWLHKDGEIYDRTIDSHVSHLRSGLRDAGVTGIVISSVYGVGYRLEKKDS